MRTMVSMFCICERMRLWRALASYKGWEHWVELGASSSEGKRGEAKSGFWESVDESDIIFAFEFKLIFNF
jgi:hypothetical protein